MDDDLYQFLTMRCGFIAHYSKGGFACVYSPRDRFGLFIDRLKGNLEKDIEWSEKMHDFTDNTDSYLHGYDFSIPNAKREML